MYLLQKSAQMSFYMTLQNSKFMQSIWSRSSKKHILNTVLQ